MYENNDTVYLYHGKMNFLSFRNIGRAPQLSWKIMTPVYFTG